MGLLARAEALKFYTCYDIAEELGLTYSGAYKRICALKIKPYCVLRNGSQRSFYYSENDFEKLRAKFKKALRYTAKEVTELTGQDGDVIRCYAQRIGFKVWTKERIDSFCLWVKEGGVSRKTYFFYDEELSARLLAIRKKYAQGVPDAEVFAFADRLTTEIMQNEEII